jgi:hypothetical protein
MPVTAALFCPHIRFKPRVEHNKTAFNGLTEIQFAGWRDLGCMNKLLQHLTS